MQDGKIKHIQYPGESHVRVYGHKKAEALRSPTDNSIAAFAFERDNVRYVASVDGGKPEFFKIYDNSASRVLDLGRTEAAWVLGIVEQELPESDRGEAAPLLKNLHGSLPPPPVDTRMQPQ